MDDKPTNRDVNNPDTIDQCNATGLAKYIEMCSLAEYDYERSVPCALTPEPPPLDEAYLSDEADPHPAGMTVYNGDISGVWTKLHDDKDHPYGPCDGEVCPLIQATRNMDAGAVSRLIEAGECLNSVDRNGNTALMNAIKNIQDDETGIKCATILQLLITGGADVTLANLAGVTPLVECCRNQMWQMALQLLDAGGHATCDVGRANEDGCAAFRETMRWQKFRWHCDVLSLNEPRDGGNYAILEGLLQAGCDPDTADRSGDTLLVSAIDYCKPEVVRMLIKANACVDGNTANSKQLTPFQSAFVIGYSIITSFIVGKPINRNKLQDTLNMINILQLLVYAGADVSSHKGNIDCQIQEIKNKLDVLYENRSDDGKIFQDVLSLIALRKRQPRSLLDMCRLRVRSLLRPRFKFKLGQLQLPERIQSDVSLEDLPLVLM